LRKSASSINLRCLTVTESKILLGWRNLYDLKYELAY